MPIIVDEIVISVELTNQEAGGAPAAAGGALAAAERQTLVNDCVERVLDVLARKEER
jgi:Family of unknown function (DUF5908)